MAYRDDVSALSPDHLWRFDADNLDSVGSVNAVTSGFGIGLGSAITEDAANSAITTTTAGRASVNSSGVSDAQSRKAFGGWVRLDRVQPPPKSLYGEGTSANQIRLVCWGGNALMLDSVQGSQVDQLFADRTLAPNRTFHVFFKFEGTGFSDTLELYLDGVLQDSTALGLVELSARGTNAEWADPAGATEVGNQVVLLNSPFNCEWAYWASWANKTLPTASEIRTELFEKGALPAVTITSDTEVNMQAALDALADTTRGDEPLNIRVEGVSGGGTLNLTADNIVHSPLASIHVQYTGTDTLNWTNVNGSNANIGSATNGGVLNFINPAVLTLEPLIADSEVRIYEAGTTTEIAGIESSGTSFQTSIEVNSVDIVIHKEDYEYVRIAGVDTSGGDLTVPIDQVFDRNYANV